MSKTLSFTLLLLLTCSFLTGCYRMPGDDEYSLIPSTNNPDTTKQRPDNNLPKVSY